MELKNKKRDFRRTISALLVAALVFSCFGGSLQGVVVKANGVSGQATGGNVHQHSGGEATCKLQAICEECGESYGELAPSNHKNTEVRGYVKETCGTAGYTGDTWCTDCNTEILKGEPTEATGAHTGGEATCKDKAVCDVCSTPYGELNPNNHKNTEVRGKVTGNCGEAGYTGDTWCTDCNTEISKGEPTDPSDNHTGGEATCKDKAVCDVCSTPYGELDPNNHKNKEVRDYVKETCGTAGYTGDTWCKDCNTKIATGKTIAATGKHSVKTQITKADATKKTNGTNVSYCTVCKKTIKTNATYYYPKSVTVSTVTYNGKSQTPKVVVKDSKGKTISSSHYTVSKVKKVGKSTITITFKSSSAYYVGKLTAKCTVNPTATKFTKVTAGKKKLTLKWSKKTSEVTGYIIEYSTDKKFKKGVKKVTIKKNKTTSTTISKLSAKKKYYVRIRTYKGSYKSSWSSVKSATTKK